MTAADTAPPARKARTPRKPRDRVRKASFTQALNNALDLAMDKHSEMFLIGEDIAEMGGDFGVTKGLLAKYGADRVRDTPLSEAAIIGTCAGAAMVGMRPVAEIMFADFIAECYDQIVNNVAKLHYMFDGQFKAPLVIRTACGGGFGGGPHHSQSVEGWFLNVPGIVIVAPSNPVDAKGLLLASIDNDNPVLFLEHKALYRSRAEVPPEYYTTRWARLRSPRQRFNLVGQFAVPWRWGDEQAAADPASRVEVVDLRDDRPRTPPHGAGCGARRRVVGPRGARRAVGARAQRASRECFALKGPGGYGRRLVLPASLSRSPWRRWILPASRTSRRINAQPKATDGPRGRAIARLKPRLET